MESAEVKRGVWRRRLAIVAAIVAAAVLVWFVTTEPVRHPRQDVGGEAGVLQDGAYYVFAGSGFPGPDEARVPQGIFRYVPGEGKEQLVSYQAHRMDVLFSCWGVNTHSLYYVDIDTNALWRQGPDHWRGDPAIHGPRPRGTGSGTGGGGPVELLCPWGGTGAYL